MTATTTARPSGGIAEAILQLHQPTGRAFNGLGCPRGWMRCSAGCHRAEGSAWPCRTIRALYAACGLPSPDPVPTPRDHAKFVGGQCRAGEELGTPCRWDLDHQDDTEEPTGGG